MRQKRQVKNERDFAEIGCTDIPKESPGFCNASKEEKQIQGAG